MRLQHDVQMQSSESFLLFGWPVSPAQAWNQMVADKDAGTLQSDLLGPSDAPLRLAVSVAVRFETVETVGVSKELECATENVRRPNEEQLKHFSDRVAYGPWPHLICFYGLACEVGSPAR